MADHFSATFSGPDMPGLARALISAAPYTSERPTEMRRKLAPVPVVDDWREQLVSDGGNGLSASWGRGRRISRDAGAIGVGFPGVDLDPQQVLAHVAALPFELAVVPPQDAWRDGYYAPAISGDHALLGWAAIFKGAGHERHLVSRRWIDHGPWRVWRGDRDTTLVQFHRLGADEDTATDQAQPGHAWLVAGFLRAKHAYRHDIAGVYTAEDRLLRVVVNDREVSDAELTDACAARRDRANDAARPLANVCYVFDDERAARARLDALWLRGLECRALVKGREHRLDEGHVVQPPAPEWTR